MKALLLLSKLIFLFHVFLASEIEDKLETEIDLREPRSFLDRQFKILDVRQDGFNSMVCKNEDGEEDREFVPNWEVFAAKYV